MSVDLLLVWILWNCESRIVDWLYQIIPNLLISPINATMLDEIFSNLTTRSTASIEKSHFADKIFALTKNFDLTHRKCALL